MKPAKGTLLPGADGDWKQIAVRLPAHEFDEYASIAANAHVSMVELLRYSIRKGIKEIKRPEYPA
jgi:hypothetical protein